MENHIYPYTCVVVASSLASLEAQVKHQMEAGYVLLGGVCVVFTSSHTQEFYQPLLHKSFFTAPVPTSDGAAE